MLCVLFFDNGCGGYRSHRPTGPATSQGFDLSRGDPKKPASVFMCRRQADCCLRIFCVKIYIDIKYYKVFISRGSAEEIKDQKRRKYFKKKRKGVTTKGKEKGGKRGGKGRKAFR